jgi:hypothetical protein
MPNDADLTAVIEHRAGRALGEVSRAQMCLPNGTSSRLISVQYFRRSFASSARIVPSGAEAEIWPQGFEPLIGVTVSLAAKLDLQSAECTLRDRSST